MAAWAEGAWADNVWAEGAWDGMGAGEGPGVGVGDATPQIISRGTIQSAFRGLRGRVILWWLLAATLPWT